MDKITEEILTNLIKRVEKLEQGIRAPTQSRPIVKSGAASQAQMNYLVSLGGEVYEGMTKGEAGQAIDRLLAIKAQREANEGKVQQEGAEGPEEPEYEEPEPNPLTEEEIAEIGEENLL